MRRTIALAGGLALCLTMVTSTTEAATRTRTRPTGDNPLLNDVRQPATLQIGNLHVAVREITGDGAYVAKAIDLRTAAAAQRSIQINALDVASSSGLAVDVAEKLSERLVERKSNLRIQAVSRD